MKKILQKWFSSQPLSMDLGLLLLRLCLGLMALHGWSKWEDFEAGSADWPDPFHVGTKASYALTVFAELFCSVFVILGLATRVALVPLIVCMLVIVFNVHAGDPLADREHGLLYLLGYLALFLTGPGKISLQQIPIFKRS
jgi:putative oxidoreductase